VPDLEKPETAQKTQGGEEARSAMGIDQEGEEFVSAFSNKRLCERWLGELTHLYSRADDQTTCSCKHVTSPFERYANEKGTVRRSQSLHNMAGRDLTFQNAAHVISQDWDGGLLTGCPSRESVLMVVGNPR